jgi:hypothetical protein
LPIDTIVVVVDNLKGYTKNNVDKYWNQILGLFQDLPAGRNNAGTCSVSTGQFTVL